MPFVILLRLFRLLVLCGVLVEVAFSGLWAALLCSVAPHYSIRSCLDVVRFFVNSYALEWIEV
jgi:hypothetical protein